MTKELEWRQNIHKQVKLYFLPFCLANGVFILPFRMQDAKLNFYVTGVCHFVMLITYIFLQVAFLQLEFKVWTALKMTNFV